MGGEGWRGSRKQGPPLAGCAPPRMDAQPRGHQGSGGRPTQAPWSGTAGRLAGQVGFIPTGGPGRLLLPHSRTQRPPFPEALHLQRTLPSPRFASHCAAPFRVPPPPRVGKAEKAGDAASETGWSCAATGVPPPAAIVSRAEGSVWISLDQRAAQGALIWTPLTAGHSFGCPTFF